MQRTDRFSLVVEQSYDDLNHNAVLRTADLFGVQKVCRSTSSVDIAFECNVLQVYLVVPTEEDRKNMDWQAARGITTGRTYRYVTITRFKRIVDCIEHLQKEGREIWVTGL